MVMAGVSTGEAQPLGSFSWQLQPYCNRVTVNVRQDGSVYTLDGTDDLCGAAQKAPLVGLAAPNPDGSIGFGLNIVSPTGQSIPVQARISIATLSGTWSDSAGNSGTFAFGANTGGSPRPNTPSTGGDITGVAAGSGLTGGGTAGDVSLAVDPTAVQSRVTTACPAGQAIRSIAQSGTAVCEAVQGTAGGDITAVTAGVGLTGGGPTGDVVLSVAFGGTGVAPTAARSDHTHQIGTNQVGIGPAALGVSTGIQNTAVGFEAFTDNTTANFGTAVGFRALGNNSSGSNNTAVGANAMSGNTTGAQSTAVGLSALATNGTGTQNTAVGYLADVTSGALTNATAIGARAEVSQSNSLVLGSIAGVNGATNNASVGIGTTAPTARLEIATQAVADEFSIRVAGGIPQVIGRASDGTLAAPTATPDNRPLLSLEAEGYDGDSFEQGARMLFETTQTWSGVTRGSRIRFFTTLNGTTTTTDRMVIDQNGEVGIGTLTPADTLHVNGDVRVLNCVRNGAGTQIAGTCASDARFKKDIRSFPNLLDRVAQLRPVNYYWRAAEFPAKAWSTDQTYGLVAQEVEAVMPDMVETTADGYKAVNYSKLPLVLLQAVRELKAANDALADRNQTLEREGAALADRLAAIERRLAATGAPEQK
jgi:hypothetical protein